MERTAAITAVLGAVQERWGAHSLTRGYNGARGSGVLASRAVRAAAPALPPWWPGAEGYLRPNVLELRGPASCGKLGLALLWLAAAERGGLTAVVDLARTFYPPAAAASGLDLERLIVIRPPDRRGAAEAVSLLLTSAGFDAVLWPVEWKTRPSGLDAARLATLAARSGTTLLALVTDRRRAIRSNAAASGQRDGLGAFPDAGSDAILPSADVRLQVTGWEWVWRDGELAGVCPRVRTERLRGALAGQEWDLRLEHHAPSRRATSVPGPEPFAPSQTPSSAQARSTQFPGSAGFQPAPVSSSLPSPFPPTRRASAPGNPADLPPSAKSSHPAVDDEAPPRQDTRPAGFAAGHPGSPPPVEHPGSDFHLSARPGGCPPTDHLCLAAALPLGGGSARAAGPAGAADRGVRSDAAPAPAARTA